MRIEPELFAKVTQPAAKAKLDPISRSVREVILYLGIRHVGDNAPLRFQSGVGGRAQHARQLVNIQPHLLSILQSFPREAGENVTNYINRVRQSIAGRVDEVRVLDMVGRLKSTIDRFDDEAELEARRIDDDRKAQEEAQLVHFRNQANPDPDEVAKLQATIEEAKQHEDLLASIFAAFTAHRQAQVARQSLAAIFASAATARESLRDSGETVSTKLMKRPRIADAPAGAIDFATAIARSLNSHRGG
jgi:hypothetical protein